MWSQWYLIKEKNTGGVAIKRYTKKPDGKTSWQRFPAAEYKSLSHQKIEELVRRLNITETVKRKQAEERYNFDHAFVSTKVKERYEEYLMANANDAKHIATMMSNLDSYVLEYFVLEQKLPDPKFWKQVEDKWGLWLIDTKKLAYNTTLQVIHNANRFLAFLHEKVYPTEIPVIKLKPLSKNKLKLHKAKTTNATYKYIKPEAFEDILKHAEEEDPTIIPNLQLCYKFGVRATESLGFTSECIFEDMLEVKQQGASCKNGKMKLRPVKDIDKREVPYWFATPDEAYDWIAAVKPMGPRTLKVRLNEVLAKFGHTSHDLRRSFATTALRKYHWKDVKNAMGHEEIETTLKYDLAEQESERKPFVPKKK